MSATTTVGVHFDRTPTRDDLSVCVTRGQYAFASFRVGETTVFVPGVDDLRAFGLLLVALAEEHGDPCCTYTFPLPSWMGEDQDDPCRCDLPKGHDGKHACEHTRSNDAPYFKPEDRPEVSCVSHRFKGVGA